MPKRHIRSIHIYSSSFSTAALRGTVRTPVMHQHTTGHIIGMIVLDLEVIDLDGAFEQLVLDFFDDDIFAVDKDENVTRAEVRRIRPALDRTIERVRWRSNNFLDFDEYVRQLRRLIDIGFDGLKPILICDFCCMMIL